MSAKNPTAEVTGAGQKIFVKTKVLLEKASSRAFVAYFGGETSRRSSAPDEGPADVFFCI